MFVSSGAALWFTGAVAAGVGEQAGVGEDSRAFRGATSAAAAPAVLPG